MRAPSAWRCLRLYSRQPTTAAVAPAPSSSPPASPAAAEGALGRLAWGTNPTSGRPWTSAEIARGLATNSADDLTRQTRRVVQLAEETLGADVPVVARIDREGVLASDARYRASTDALAGVDRVYQWAMCGRVAAEPLAGRCQIGRAHV